MMAARRQREILTYSLLINACDTSVYHPTSNAQCTHQEIIGTYMHVAYDSQWERTYAITRSIYLVSNLCVLNPLDNTLSLI